MAGHGNAACNIQTTSQSPVKIRVKIPLHGRSIRAAAAAPRPCMCQYRNREHAGQKNGPSIRRRMRLYTLKPCEQLKLHRCLHRIQAQGVLGVGRTFRYQSLWPGSGLAPEIFGAKAFERTGPAEGRGGRNQCSPLQSLAVVLPWSVTCRGAFASAAARSRRVWKRFGWRRSSRPACAAMAGMTLSGENEQNRQASRTYGCSSASILMSKSE
mmetsp:Transcript_39892/g.106999  ORF Transcript_39892/g.106999 Transcript_39892/m.106999 type:complete len:212 (-) Transcript_39892:632-1267(-)